MKSPLKIAVANFADRALDQHSTFILVSVKGPRILMHIPDRRSRQGDPSFLLPPKSSGSTPVWKWMDLDHRK